jgi:hypothetical protein
MTSPGLRGGFHSEAHSWRRAGVDDVARIENHELAQVPDDVMGGEHHRAGMAGLAFVPIHRQMECQVLWVRDFVGSDEPRTERVEGLT